MATYYVTGIWKDNNQLISHIYLHPVREDQFYTGTKTAVSAAIQLINSGDRLFTLRWDYHHAGWYLGGQLQVSQSGGDILLGTPADTAEIDRLENMIDMRF